MEKKEKDLRKLVREEAELAVFEESVRRRALLNAFVAGAFAMLWLTQIVRAFSKEEAQ